MQCGAVLMNVFSFSIEYRTESINKAALKKYADNDATPEMFAKVYS